MVVTIKAAKDGPYLIMKDGKVVLVLCRCGASKKMPYCDGMHRKIGFKGEEAELTVE